MGTDNMESLRKIYESDEMWNLRRKFLDTYWNDERFTKNRLYCLAQMLVNMEFLGCTYNEALMKKVNEMADDMLQSRRLERKAVVEKIFIKSNDDQAGATTTAQERPNLKRRLDNGDGSNFDFKKPKLGDAASNDMVDLGGGFWRQQPSPETPATVTKLKSMQLVKAKLSQAKLSQASKDLKGVELMNFACNQCKFKWTVSFVEDSYCLLNIEEVLIVKHRFSGNDKHQASIEACQKSAELLQKTSLEVRQAEDGSLHLFTSRDVRQGWQGPEDKDAIQDVSSRGASQQTSYGGGKRTPYVPRS